MNRRSLLKLGIGYSVLYRLPAYAHKLHYTLTEMVWKPDTGGLEVTHSVHLDDAMALLARLGDPVGELSPGSQARLLLYTQQHFQLRVGTTDLMLEPVGAQIDGDYLWVYQEQLLNNYPAGLSVQCSLLHELSTTQQNQVNLRVGEDVRTLRFKVGSAAQSFD